MNIQNYIHAWCIFDLVSHLQCHTMTNNRQPVFYLVPLSWEGKRTFWGGVEDGSRNFFGGAKPSSS